MTQDSCKNCAHLVMVEHEMRCSGGAASAINSKYGGVLYEGFMPIFRSECDAWERKESQQ